MATKAVKNETPDKTVQLGLNMLNQTLVDAQTGAEFHIQADLKDIQNNIEVYFTHLCRVRGIPTNDELLPGDEVATYVYQQFYDKPAKNEIEENQRIKEVTAAVLSYYEQQRGNIQGAAVILAITINNSFKNTPRPYAQAELAGLPGIIEIPEPLPDISNARGVEYRLKQIMDFLEDNPSIATQLFAMSKELNAKVTVGLLNQLQTAGFQQS